MSNVRGGAVVGAAAGGLLGALITFIMSTTPQAIPVIGPTVGQGVIAAVVVGILAGVGVGALAGALFGAFTTGEARAVVDNRARVSGVESAVVVSEPEADVLLVDPIEDVAPDYMLESAAPEAFEMPTEVEAQDIQDIHVPVHELEGPLEIEAGVAAAEAAPSGIAPDDADAMASEVDAAEPAHISRIRRARRVAPKYQLPGSES
ncbi:MAG: hypothetical protein ABIQ44_01075 [Chloroflexia bacterium]